MPSIIFLERVVLVKISVFEESLFLGRFRTGNPSVRSLVRVTGTKGGGWGLGV